MLLGERYQTQDPIVRSHNGTSIVYRGRDTHMERDAAIKVLRDIYRDNQQIVIRFKREAKAAIALHSANVIQVYDYGQADDTPYLIMELVEGTDLRRSLLTNRVSVEQAVNIARHVALGLYALHKQGIVHKGVNPEHVLLGNNGVVKITALSMTWGPPAHYYAPEQLRDETVTPATDIYALGMVMYKMLTEHTPFEGDTPIAVANHHFYDTPASPSQFNPRITPSLEKIVLHCLEKAPERRYQDGMQLAHALDELA